LSKTPNLISLDKRLKQKYMDRDYWDDLGIEENKFNENIIELIHFIKDHLNLESMKTIQEI